MQATDDDRVQNALQVASLRTSHRTDREDLPFLFFFDILRQKYQCNTTESM